MSIHPHKRETDFTDSTPSLIPDSDILIIDDVYENLALLDRLLALKGYQVRVARDGAAGLRAAKAQPPDLILLDVRLPNVDGFAICAEMKADPVLCDIPILFISVAQDVASKLKAFAVGGVDYVTKPFHTHEVLARVETHLTLSHLRQQEKSLLLMKERQRLARELHDSVNQTLFLIGSIAEAVQLQGKVVSETFSNQLAQLQQLSQVAMAEMRVMLFELRPDTLVDTELEKLLRQLAASLASRTMGEITVIAAPLIDTLPDDIKIIFYRVAQEALSNAVKHAHAEHIAVILEEHDTQIALSIQDDGDGFDIDAISVGGLGLVNMRERTQRQGFDFYIDSQPGRATTVKLIWRKSDAR